MQFIAVASVLHLKAEASLRRSKAAAFPKRGWQTGDHRSLESFHRSVTFCDILALQVPVPLCKDTSRQSADAAAAAASFTTGVAGSGGPAPFLGRSGAFPKITCFGGKIYQRLRRPGSLLRPWAMACPKAFDRWVMVGLLSEIDNEFWHLIFRKVCVNHEIKHQPHDAAGQRPQPTTPTWVRTSSSESVSSTATKQLVWNSLGRFILSNVDWEGDETMGDVPS